MKTAQILLTRECNLSCSFCSAKDESGAALKSRPVEIWIGIIEALAGLGVSVLKIGGGEATLYPDITDVINEAKVHGMKVVVLTNGFVPGSDILKLVKFGVDCFGVSYDMNYPSASIEPLIRGQKMVSKSIGAKRVMRILSQSSLSMAHTEVLANVIIDPLDDLSFLPVHIERLLQEGFFINVCPLHHGGTPPKGEWRFRAPAGTCLPMDPDPHPDFLARYLEMSYELIDLSREYSKRFVVSEDYLRNLYPWGLSLNRRCFEIGGPRVLFVDWDGKAVPCMDVTKGSCVRHAFDLSSEAAWASFRTRRAEDTEKCSGCYYSNVYGGNFGEKE